MSDESKYFKPSVTADCVAIRSIRGSNTHQILLVKRGREPFKGFWALPGGFMDFSDESHRACAIREVMEETGVDVSDNLMDYVSVWDKPGRDPRGPVISIATCAHRQFDTIEEADKEWCVKAGDDAAEAKWFELHEVVFGNSVSLAFDHKDIIARVMRKVW